MGEIDVAGDHHISYKGLNLGNGNTVEYWERINRKVGGVKAIL